MQGGISHSQEAFVGMLSQDQFEQLLKIQADNDVPFERKKKKAKRRINSDFYDTTEHILKFDFNGDKNRVMNNPERLALLFRFFFRWRGVEGLPRFGSIMYVFFYCSILNFAFHLIYFKYRDEHI